MSGEAARRCSARGTWRLIKNPLTRDGLEDMQNPAATFLGRLLNIPQFTLLTHYPNAPEMTLIPSMSAPSRFALKIERKGGMLKRTTFIATSSQIQRRAELTFTSFFESGESPTIVGASLKIQTQLLKPAQEDVSTPSTVYPNCSKESQELTFKFLNILEEDYQQANLSLRLPQEINNFQKFPLPKDLKNIVVAYLNQSTEEESPQHTLVLVRKPTIPLTKRIKMYCNINF